MTLVNPVVKTVVKETKNRLWAPLRVPSWHIAHIRLKVRKSLENGRFRMKKGFPVFTGNPARGAKGIRTPDPLHAMEMRYQLRHSPVVCLANVE